MKLLKGKVNFVTDPEVITDINNVEPLGRLTSGENAGELVTIPFSEFSGGIDQDNIDIRKNVLTNSSDLTDILAAINALPSYTVSQIQSVWFTVSVNENDAVSTYFYKLFNKGKGTYGVGGIQITRGDLGLINANVPAADEVESDPTTDTVNYGALTTQNVSEWLNTQTTPIVIQPQTDGYTLFKGTINGVEQSYLFVGASGTYGVGQLQSTVSDFQLLSETTPVDDYIPRLGTEPGRPVTGDIEMLGSVKIYSSDDVEGLYSIFGFQDGYSTFKTTNTSSGFSSEIFSTGDDLIINATNPDSKGLTANYDFTANAIGDLDYVQRKGIVAMINAVPNLLKSEYTATGGETSITVTDLIGRTIMLFNRTQPYKVITSGTPTGLQVLFNNTTGSLTFDATYPLNPTEYINILSQSSTPVVPPTPPANYIVRTVNTYNDMLSTLSGDSPTVTIRYIVLNDTVYGDGKRREYTHYNNELTYTVMVSELNA